MLLGNYYTIGLLTITIAAFPGCRKAETGARTVQTELGAKSCAREIDHNDPNETPYLKCPGTGGYTLVVRKAEAGRKTVDVVDPRQRVFPLHYDETITRRMFALGDKAEWRVLERGGKPQPIALIARVTAHEDEDDPAKVTRTYLAVAKITAAEACVTDRMVEGAQSEEVVRKMADTARERPCLQPQPPLDGGTTIR